MKKILIGTGNKGKLVEIKHVFAGLGIELLGLEDLGLINDVVESGVTYEENALIKAKYFFEKIDGVMPVLADDSGLVVDALVGELGVFTRRWGAGHEVSDIEWLDHFMKRMEMVENRKARFVSFAVLYLGEGDYKVFEGEVTGVITQTIEAPVKHGLPLSSVFRPDGFEKVFSAMTAEDKMKNSHRGFAMSKVKEYLEGVLKISGV